MVDGNVVSTFIDRTRALTAMKTAVAANGIEYIKKSRNSVGYKGIPTSPQSHQSKAEIWHCRFFFFMYIYVVFGIFKVGFTPNWNHTLKKNYTSICKNRFIGS